METPKEVETFVPDAGRRMLGDLLAVVSPLLALTQIVIFFANRWSTAIIYTVTGRVESTSLNPLVAWCPLWIAILFGIWLWAARRFRVRFHLPLLLGSLLTSLVFVVWGLTLEPPTAQRLDGDPLDEFFHQQPPKLQYPTNIPQI